MVAGGQTGVLSCFWREYRTNPPSDLLSGRRSSCSTRFTGFSAVPFRARPEAAASAAESARRRTGDGVSISRGMAMRFGDDKRRRRGESDLLGREPLAGAA